ncbi:phage major tail tube protein [Planktotalea sp.]|uniref:phage major tail tube protein n=1 Tax=Planktotalea sp. TaxID=2029877 RepID=UPI003D6B14BA
MLQYGQITDAPVYLDDKSLVGHCEEFNIPEIETQTIEHDTLGSIGVMKLPRRGLSALEGSLIMSFAEPEFLSITSNPRKAARFQVHSKLDIFDAMGLDETNSTTLVTHVTALFHKSAFPGAKKADAGKHNADFSVTRLMQRDINSGTPIVEIDLFANIYKVLGENVWPD